MIFAHVCACFGKRMMETRDNNRNQCRLRQNAGVAEIEGIKKRIMVPGK
jgi:hypothetical protein